MAFLLKVRWEIKPGMQNQFCQSEKALAEVMLNHPGVICYHADYPEPNLSEWVEIYANDDTFASHLDDPGASQPLGELINCCSKVSCRCWAIPTPPPKNGSKPSPLNTRTLARALLCSTPMPILTPTSEEMDQRPR